MMSDGRAQRPFCYLADAVRAYFRVLLKGQVMYPYNVANPSQIVSVLELAERLVRLFPERGLKVIRKETDATDQPSASTVITGCAPDITRIGALGWQPRVGIDEGFSRTVKSYE
jgi:nucleoside-diphosphate-sugar epimerase